MGIFIVITFLALSSWALVALPQRLRRKCATRRWWVACGVLIPCGVALGVWSAFSVEYRVGTHYRIASFPLPVTFFHLEQSGWVDFPVPEFQAWLTVFTNVIAITTLATLPLWLLSWRQHRHGSLTHSPAKEATPEIG